MREQEKIQNIESVIEEFIDEISLLELSSYFVTVYSDLEFNL